MAGSLTGRLPRRHPAMGLRDARTGTWPTLPASEGPDGADPRGVGPVHRRIVPMRSITRAGRRPIALAAGLLLVAISAAPALACGGLIGPNGAVNLLRTTTFAGYHDGVEHYVTAFQFAGGGGAFGSLTPLPGVPTSVEKGGDWTLQRLIRETDPVPEADRALLAAAAPSASAQVLMQVRI